MHYLKWKEHALHDLNNIDKNTAKRIIVKIEEMCENPSSCDIKKLNSFDGHYRLRVGHYRVIFEITSDLVTILKVGHRQNIYE